MKFYGTVHNSKPARYFGFIRRSDGEADTFFHFSNTPGGTGIDIGVTVEFEIGRDKNGRPMAINIVPLPWQESPASVSAGGEHVEV
jgi:cold shock CspA family protein